VRVAVLVLLLLGGCALTLDPLRLTVTTRQTVELSRPPPPDAPHLHCHSAATEHP
jgi:hypothetical protein